MNEGELTLALQDLQAQMRAIRTTVRFLVARQPDLAQEIMDSLPQLAATLPAQSLTERQIEVVLQTLRTLAAAPLQRSN